MNARDLSSRLAELLRREHHAFAEFLLALADFDRRRAWEELGYATLFAFLHRELGLSKGSAYYRKVAAELVQRFPEIVEPLRDGRLCVTSVVELSKVLTPANREEVLPRFFHRSKQEAKAITAELRPRESPASRDVVTAPRSQAGLPDGGAAADEVQGPEVASSGATLFDSSIGGVTSRPAERVASGDVGGLVQVEVQPVEPPHANSPEAGWAGPPRAAPRDVAEPMTAELRRLHVTVSRRFLAKLDAARDALSHARPGASTEDVLEAALDLLLAQDARRRAAAAKNPRAAAKADLPVGADGDEPGPSTDGRRVAEAPATRAARHVPAAVRREVWARDEARCQWPLSSGGVCGSTHRLELDHVHPVALGGPSTAANVRILCERHNKLAARRVFGDAWIDRCARSREPALPLLSGES